MKKKKKRVKKLYNKIFMRTPTDFTVVFIVLFLVAFGVIMIYSSTFRQETSKDFLSSSQMIESENQIQIKESPIKKMLGSDHTKQMLFAALGFIVMYLVSKIRLDFLNRFAGLMYVFIIGMLILILFMGQDTKGAKRWFELGPIKIQPSIIATFVLILSVSYLLTYLKYHLAKWRVLTLIFMLILLPAYLVFREDFSMSLVILGVCVGMIFVAHKSSFKIVFMGLLLLAILVFFAVLTNYRSSRIDSYLAGPWEDPENTGYQVIQSLYSIGSGGLTGNGLGMSIQKMGRFPEAHNDYIFAIICEELGLFGGIAIILLFGVLLYRMLQIALTAKSMNHYLVVMGVMIHIGIQTFFNIGVSTNLLPSTGIPLPFVSYGGSSLVMLLAEIGLVLNVARHNVIEELVGGIHESK